MRSLLTDALQKFIASGLVDYSYPTPEKYSMDLSLSINPLGCSDSVKQYLQICEINVTSYSEPVSDTLRKKISHTYGVEVDNVLVGADKGDVLLAALHAIVEEKDEVIMPRIATPTFEFLTLLAKGKPVFIPFTPEFDMDYDAIEKLISEKTKAVVLSNPNNPTGKCIQTAKIEKYIQKYPEVLFIIDEANVDFGNSTFLPLVYLYENVLVLRSFAKAFGLAGLSVGFAVGSQPIIYDLRRRQLPFAVNTIGQQAAIIALEDMKFVEKTRNYVLAERQYLEKELMHMGYSYVSSESNYLLVNVTNHFKNSHQVIKELHRNDAHAVNGAHFHNLGAKYIRLTPRLHEVNQRFLHVMKTITQENQQN